MKPKNHLPKYRVWHDIPKNSESTKKNKLKSVQSYTAQTSSSSNKILFQQEAFNASSDKEIHQGQLLPTVKHKRIN